MNAGQAAADTSLLPPPGTPARTATVALLVLAPLAFGFLALLLGPDASWDLRNYHWYNAWAFLTGRIDLSGRTGLTGHTDLTGRIAAAAAGGRDFMPSQGEFFLNPLSDVPFYWLATHLPPRAAFFILGAVQGLNFPLVFLLSYRCLALQDAARKAALSALLALLGTMSAIGISEIGTVFQDNITSLGVLGSALLLLGRLEKLLAERTPAFALLAGIPAGAAAGLKITCLGWCVGLCIALLIPTRDTRRCFAVSFVYGLGVLLGLALTDGFWAWHLYTHYGSPLFPFYNVFFRSPLLPPTAILDYATPRDLRLLVFPFFFGADYRLVNEVPWRDWRVPLLYALFLLLVVLKCLPKDITRKFGEEATGKNSFTDPLAARVLMITAGVVYYVWLFTETVYRYLMPLDMLCPLLIVLAANLLPGSLRFRAGAAAVLLGIMALSLQPADWGRQITWPDSMVSVSIPALYKKELAATDGMVLLAGFDAYAYLLPAFPPRTSFVRIQSRGFPPEDDTGLIRSIRARIDAQINSHKQPVLLLLLPAGQLPAGKAALAHYGLALDGTCEKVFDNRQDPRVSGDAESGDNYPAVYDLCAVGRLRIRP